MFAFPAAKRTILLVMSLLIMIPAASSLAAYKTGYLGVTLQDVSPSMAKALRMGDETGVLINQVIEDSPAEKAGLQDGDVIIAFEGKSLGDYSDLTRAVGAHKPGTKVTVTVLRDGRKKDVKVELGERDDRFSWSTPGHDFDFDFDFEDMDDAKLHEMLKDKEHAWVFEGDDEVFTLPEGEHGKVIIKRLGDGDELKAFTVGSDRGFMGVHLDDLNAQLGDYFGVKEGKGALVTEVNEDSPAAAAGLKAGDVIVKLDDTEIADAGEIHEFMAGTEKDQKVKVHFVRKGKAGKAEVTLGEAPEIKISDHIKIMGDRAHNMHFDGPRKMRIMRAPGAEHHLEMMRDLHGDSGADLKEMREELEQMKKELQAMKKELKK